MVNIPHPNIMRFPRKPEKKKEKIEIIRATYHQLINDQI